MESTPKDDGDASSSSSSVSSTGTLVPDPASNSFSIATSSWHDCFEQELFFRGPRATHHAYFTSPASPAKDPLFVCHHGAGSSGLSFALFAKYVKKLMPNAGILSVDARGHGLTVEHDSGALNARPNLSLPQLTDDLVEVVNSTRLKFAWPDVSNLLLVGHSLGGAVVTNLVTSNFFTGKIVGYAVLDVVEGSALDALKSMQALLAVRPSLFDSIDSAIDWHVRTRTIRDADSARLSTPSLLKEAGAGRWTWRTDLASTKEYWEGWFTGMSKNFLSGKAAKLLILAGTDRLDRDLMIGQMQGKFQLQVFPESGHFVQEDQAERTAEVLTEFYKRNDRSALVLPPKVSDLLKQGKKV